MFWVATIETKKVGISYTVTISEYPICSCPEFACTDASKESYQPFKHIYIYKSMHQAILPKFELSQTLLGHHSIPFIDATI